METEQKDAPAAAAAAAPAPQEVEEVIKKKRTRKTNVNFSAQTAGMKTEQLTVGIWFPSVYIVHLESLACSANVHAACHLPLSLYCALLASLRTLYVTLCTGAAQFHG